MNGSVIARLTRLPVSPSGREERFLGECNSKWMLSLVANRVSPARAWGSIPPLSSSSPRDLFLGLPQSTGCGHARLVTVVAHLFRTQKVAVRFCERALFIVNFSFWSGDPS